MDRRRLLFVDNKPKTLREQCIFYGICTDKSIGAAAKATDLDIRVDSPGQKPVFELNEDGTYTFYLINNSKNKAWNGVWGRNKTSPLKSIALDSDVTITKNPTSLYGMFTNCINLEAVSGLSHIDFSKVTDFSYMFDSCWSLQDIGLSIDGMVTSKCTSLCKMFYMISFALSNSKKLDLCSLGDYTTWDVSNVTDFSNLFASSVAKSKFSISGWNMASAVNLEGAFSFSSASVIDMSGIKLNPTKLRHYSSGETTASIFGPISQLILTNVNNTNGLIEFMESAVYKASRYAHILLDDGMNSYDSTKKQGWAPDYRIAACIKPKSVEVPTTCHARPAKGGTDNIVSLIHTNSQDYNVTADDIAAIKDMGASATEFTFDARCVFPEEASTNATNFFSGLFNSWTSLKTVRITGIDDAVVLALKSSNFGNTDAAILANLEVISDNGTFVYQNNLWTLKS